MTHAGNFLFIRHYLETVLENDKKEVASLQEILEANENVIKTITHLSSKNRTIISCSSFIILVSEFDSIANQTSKVEEVKSLATNITSVSVDSCDSTQLSSLENSL